MFLIFITTRNTKKAWFCLPALLISYRNYNCVVFLKQPQCPIVHKITSGCRLCLCMAEIRLTFNDNMVLTSALNYTVQFTNHIKNLKFQRHYKVALKMLMLLADLQVPPSVSNKVFLPKIQVSMCFTVSQLFPVSWMDFAAGQQSGRLKTASGNNYCLDETHSGSFRQLLTAKLHYQPTLIQA